MQLDYNCYGIASKSGELSVSNLDNSMYVHITAGKFFTDLQGRFSCTLLFNNLCVSASDHTLYVADQTKGLRAVDTQTGHEVYGSLQQTT